MIDEQIEARLVDLLVNVTSTRAWAAKEDSLQQIAPLISQHPDELQEALLLTGPTAVVDSILSVIISQRTKLPSKLLAADVLSEVCSNCSKACLLLCPSNLVERLMRCAYKGDGDMKAAAARALWQLSCHHDFSPEVVSHAGNAFKVVDLLAEDMQQGSSSTCMCALRATQNLLQAYITHGAGDAGERIGGRIIEPLCNLLEANHPEAAAAAAELLALLGQSAPNRARIVGLGGVQRLVMLMRQCSNNCSNLAANHAADGLQEQQQKQAAMQQQETAAAQAVHALAQLARGDNKLCLDLLGAHVMPGLLQLLRLKGCSAGALGLIGDLVVLPEGRRALQYAEGFTALADAAQVCPEGLMCRLLSKATKGSTLLSQDLAHLASSSPLLAVLVHCCGLADKKTRKRAMQVLGRLLEHSRATGRVQQLQSQLLNLGLLQQIQQVLSSLLPQKPVGGANSTNSSSSGGSSSSVLELQLVLSLLLEVATSAKVLTTQRQAPKAAAAAVAGTGDCRSVADLSSDQKASQAADKQQQQQAVSQLSMALKESSAAGAAGDQAIFPAASVAQAVVANPAVIWRYPAAAAAAFGDMSGLVPDQHNRASQQKTADARQPAAAETAAQKTASPTANPTADQIETALVEQDVTLPSILWLLLQLLLSPQHQLPSLQQQVLQVVCELAAHRQQPLLELMVKQGWVQVVWSFLPGGRQLLAITISQLIQQHTQPQRQQQQQQSATVNTAVNAASTGPRVASPRAAAATARDKPSNLQPHLLQSLDESLPSIEQTTYALQALANLCSCASAAAIVVQLQASYQSAAASGVLSVRSTAHMLQQQGADPAAAGAVNVTSNTSAAAGVVSMLFGSSASPRAAAAAAAAAVKAGPGFSRSHSQPSSPKTLPSTPLSFASSSSSSSGGSTVGSYVAVAAPSSTISTSSSLPSSTMMTSRGGSSGDGSSSSSSLLRTSSTGLLSRLGMGRKDSNAQQKGGIAAASPTASAAAADSGVVGGDPAAAPAGAAGDPVEDPGSPIDMLVTLLGEQWAATASAEVLARLSAVGPEVCVPAMVLQGVVATLRECMGEIQDNSAGAIAALATLQLVKQLSVHCPEQLHTAGIVAIVLRMLVQGCGRSDAVPRAALDVVVVLCQQGDRHLCAAVAQAALLPLVRWLGSGRDQAAAAAAVLTALLDSGVVDGSALASLESSEKASELLALCLGCLQSSSSSSSGVSAAAAVTAAKPQHQQQQQAVELTAMRLIRSLVELDAHLVDAFLAADGLATLLNRLSAAVKASSSSSSSQASAAEFNRSAAAAAANSPAGDAVPELHNGLILQYECLAVLDSLSLVHRRVLVQAAIIPIIVGVLRQQSNPAAAAATRDSTAPFAPITAAAAGCTATEQPNSRSSSGQIQDPNPTAHRGSISRLTRTTSSHSSSSGSGSKTLARSSSKSPGAATGLSARVMTPAELLLRCKVIACNLITVLAINNEVKRQLFHSDAVGPLMQLADVVEDGSSAQEAIRAALAQLGLVYLLPAGSAV